MRSEGEGQATGLHCGECMVVEGELVALLPSGRCPKCGADYGDVLAVMRAAKREADQALVEVQAASIGCPACNFGKAVCGCDKQGDPERGHRGTQYYYPEGKWGDE